MTYRNGNRNARNIYRVGPGGEEHIGCAFTEDDGWLIVEALNRRETPIRIEMGRDLTPEQLAAFKAVLRKGLLGAFVPEQLCGVPFGTGGVTCQRAPHTPASDHGAETGAGLVRW